MAKPTSLKNKLVPVVAATGIAILGWWAWDGLSDSGPGAGFVSGNGRIEATEVDVATKLPGRVEEILVREGDFVRSGQPLARMQLASLDAQRNEAEAGRQQAVHATAASEAQVMLRQSDVAAAQAQVAQREAELDAANRRLPGTGR
jgi:HlyD family secretion protein